MHTHHIVRVQITEMINVNIIIVKKLKLTVLPTVMTDSS